MNGGAGDMVGLRELAKALTLAAVSQDADAIEIEWFAADMPALKLGAAHSGADAFDNEAAFQLGDDSDDYDDRPTQRTAGVYLLAKTYKLDVEMIQFIEYFEKVLHGTGQPIGSPNQDHVEAAAAGVLHHFIETRAPGFGTADLICILRDDLIIALGSHLLEIVELGLGVLVEGGHSQIEDGALHGGHEISI